MDNFNTVKAKDGKLMCYRIYEGDTVRISVNTLKNRQKKKKYVGKYLTVKNDEPKMIVTENLDEAVAIIQEYIIEMHTFKELWDLFKKVLFRIPKVEDIIFRIIKEV